MGRHNRGVEAAGQPHHRPARADLSQLRDDRIELAGGPVAVPAASRYRGQDLGQLGDGLLLRRVARDRCTPPPNPPPCRHGPSPASKGPPGTFDEGGIGAVSSCQLGLDLVGTHGQLVQIVGDHGGDVHPSSLSAHLDRRGPAVGIPHLADRRGEPGHQLGRQLLVRIQRKHQRHRLRQRRKLIGDLRDLRLEVRAANFPPPQRFAGLGILRCPAGLHVHRGIARLGQQLVLTRHRLPREFLKRHRRRYPRSRALGFAQVSPPSPPIQAIPNDATAHQNHRGERDDDFRCVRHGQLSYSQSPRLSLMFQQPGLFGAVSREGRAPPEQSMYSGYLLGALVLLVECLASSAVCFRATRRS